MYNTETRLYRQEPGYHRQTLLMSWKLQVYISPDTGYSRHNDSNRKILISGHKMAAKGDEKQTSASHARQINIYKPLSRYEHRLRLFLPYTVIDYDTWLQRVALDSPIDSVIWRKVNSARRDLLVIVLYLFMFIGFVLYAVFKNISSMWPTLWWQEIGPMQPMGNLRPYTGCCQTFGRL